MRRIAWMWLGLVLLDAGCGGKIAAPASSGPVDAGPPVDPYAAECVGAAVPPNSIKCTGLYTDVANGVLSADVRSYAPAVPLWADTATKRRWIWMPAGTKIDATDPNEWIFPVGTKVWKEFSRDGIRVETRLFQKVQTGFWVRTTYRWNADYTDATISAGGDIPWEDGGTYHIPTPDECDQCHRGRNDHILGFEEVSLGLSGATGLTLAELVAEELIAPVPARTSLTVGDDGTGVAAPPLEWLHINCGTTCHNDNANSTAYGSSMRLRLDPTLLDGRSSVDFDSRTTTLGMVANTPTWSGQIRIEPGDAAHSLLVELISNRGTDNPVDNQMPPIATLLVDETDTQNVVAWINAMPKAPADAGTDASVDAGTGADGGKDASPGDAASSDAAPGPDAEADGSAADGGTDATLDDGGAEDGGGGVVSDANPQGDDGSAGDADDEATGDDAGSEAAAED